MLGKLLKATLTAVVVVLDVVCDDETEQQKKEKFMREHSDGLNGINFFDESCTEEEASNAYDRGEYYY